MVVGVIAMLLGALLGATLLTLRRPAPSAPVVPAAPVERPSAPMTEAPEVEPDEDDAFVPVEPALEPAVEPAIEPAIEPAVAPTVQPSVAPASQPSPPVVPPAPKVSEVPVEPAPPAQGSVRVRGDFDSVQLVAADGAVYPPGAVPPGTYAVRAAFNGQAAAGAGEVVVVAGSESVLSCNAAFGRCQVQ